MRVIRTAMRLVTAAGDAVEAIAGIEMTTAVMKAAMPGAGSGRHHASKDAAIGPLLLLLATPCSDRGPKAEDQ